MLQRYVLIEIKNRDNIMKLAEQILFNFLPSYTILSIKRALKLRLRTVLETKTEVEHKNRQEYWPKPMGYWTKPMEKISKKKRPFTELPY